MLIIHTSDMHGKLTYLKANKIYKFKEKGAILLDSGDSISAGNLDFRFYERTLYYMSKIGYTAGAIGNREFHPIPFFLKLKLKNASFPYLSANLFSSKKIEKILPYLILNVDNHHIVLVGLTIPMIKGFWKNIFSFSFSDPILCGEKIIAKFSEKSDFIIFLTHIGINRDIKLAEKIKKPSLILGGHSHILMEEPLKVNNCYIVHSGSYARNVNIIEMESGRIKVKKEKL